MNRYIVTSFVALLAAQAVNAQTAPTVPISADDKVICRTEDVMGSRLKKQKVCLTAAQWRKSSQDSADWMNKRTQEISKPGGN